MIGSVENSKFKMSNSPKVSIIILTTNGLAMMRDELENIGKLDVNGVNAECIVVDNDSSDGTEKELADYKLPNMEYKFMEAGKNLGFAGGNNIGIKNALKRGADYIILMNNDLVLPGDILKKLVSYMEGSPEAGLASPKMYFAEGYEFHKDRYKKSELGKVIWYAGGVIDRKNAYSSHRGVDEVDHGQYDQIKDTDYASGACVIIRRAVFEKIGYLDDSFFLYWEDADFSERAKKAGFGVMYYPGTHLWHKVSASTGGSGSPTNDYFLTRNRLYFAERYLSPRTKFAVWRDTLKLIFAGRTWQKKGAIDAILGIKGMGAWRKYLISR